MVLWFEFEIEIDYYITTGTSNHNNKITGLVILTSVYKVHLLELPDPLEHAPIFVITEMIVSAATVPRVERVVPDTIKSLVREVGPIPYQHLIQVLVMAVRHENVFQPTVGFVHAIL